MNIDIRVRDEFLRVIYYSCEEITDEETLETIDKLFEALDLLGYTITPKKTGKRTGTLI